jgi:hypothetical protein
MMFVSDLCGHPLDEILYTIAHEFAHIYLGNSTYIDNSEMEIEADKQVIKWGFEKELKLSSQSYICGNKQ